MDLMVLLKMQEDCWTLVPYVFSIHLIAVTAVIVVILDCCEKCE
jgi:hypothetical protein